MDISNIPDQIWKDIITGETQYNFESLGFNVLLSNLKIKLMNYPAEESKYINEIKRMVNSQKHLPTLQRDIEKIMIRGGLL